MDTIEVPIWKLPLEVLMFILDYEVIGDNELVLVARTSKRWCEVVMERCGNKSDKKFILTLEGFLKSPRLFFWARSNGYLKLDNNVYRKAAGVGCLELVKCIRKGVLLRADWLAVRAALENGHLEIIKWLRSQGYKWHGVEYVIAVKRGYLEILKWLIVQECPWSIQDCVCIAVTEGQLEILKWLREDQGCDWRSWTCFFAASSGQLEVLKWLRENDCGWDKDTCYQQAIRMQHTEVAEWIENQAE